MPAKARRATVPSKIESHRPPVSILRVGQTQKRKRGGGGGKARAVPAAGDSGGGFVCRTAMRGATVRRRHRVGGIPSSTYILLQSVSAAATTRYTPLPPSLQAAGGDIGGGCTDLV